MIIKTPLTLKATKKQQDNLFNPPEEFPGGLFCTYKLWLFVKFGAWRKTGNEI